MKINRHLPARIAGVLMVPLLASLLQAADWPEWRGNAKRTGCYPGAPGLPGPKPAWVASLRCPFVSSPSVAGTTLFIGGRDSCIHAIDIRDGRLLWKKHTNGWVDASPLVDNGRVIAGSRDGTIYVLDAQSGTQLTSFKGGLQLSSAAMTDNGALLAGAGPPLNGFSVHSFQEGQLTETKSWFMPFNQITYSSPAVFGQLAVIGVSDGRLYGINTVVKDSVWCLHTGGGVYLSTPAIDNTMVYFAPGNTDLSIYAVNSLNGKVLWKSNDPSALSKSAAAAAISPAQFRNLLRLSPEDRETAVKALGDRGRYVPPTLTQRKPLSKTALRASADFYPYGEAKTSSVAVDSANVYVVRKELGYPDPRFTLVAVDKSTGEEQWRFSEVRSCVKLGYCSSPVTAGKAVYLGWGEGRVYALLAKTGEKVWADSVHGDVIASPAIAGSSLYVATMDGYIYRYSLGGSTLPGADFQKSTYCYPNPARDVSTIQVYVAKKGHMELALYNLDEKPLYRATADLPAMLPGDPKYTYRWDLKTVANGVYFAVVKVGYADGTSEKKVLKIAVLK